MLKKISITCIAVFILFMMGLGIYENLSGVYSSDGKSSALPELHYEVTILPDGSSRVDEYRTYKFIKGPFSRGFLEIDGRIADVEVAEEDKPYKKAEAFNNSRPQGVYAVDEKSRPARIEWYYLTKDNEIRTFKVSYTVKATSTLYNDCVDYFQKYLSSKNIYRIKKFTAIVHLPEGANRDNTKIWAHGPAGGNIEFVDDTTVELSMKNVPSGQYIEARILMPPDVLLKSENKVDANKFEELVKRENTASQKSDRKRLINGAITIFTLVVSVVLIVFPIIARIRYLRGLKRYTPRLAPAYYRDLPSNIHPAELDYLVNHLTGKENTSRQMSATILDLIQRGMLGAENIEETGLLKNKSNTVLVLNAFEKNKIAKHEKILLDFLFGIVANGASTVSLSQVEKYCSNKATAKKAFAFYSDFSRKAQSLANSRGYFENERNELPKKTVLLPLLYILLMIMPMVMMNLVEAMADSPIYIISIGSVLGFLAFTVFGPKKKKMFTQKGEDHFALWIAFKNFLSDFTTFEEKELPELFIWEKYLVYATVLDVADKLLKQLFMKYPELANEQYLQNTSLFYAMNMRSFNEASNSLERIGQSLESAMRDAANLTSKASQGSGGGFSSGGRDAGGGSGGSSGGVD